MIKIYTIILILLFFSCSNEQKKQEESIQKEALLKSIVPVDAMNVQLYANAWKFDFLYSYDDTQFKSDSLVVPVGKRVRVTMTAEESQPIHSFYVPEFRIKKDIMANKYSETWFESKYEGTYDYYCDEYCGEKHYMMNGHVVVMPKFAETFIDSNNNSKYDMNEDFDDRNYNGKWDTGYDYWFERKIAEHKASNLLAGAALGEKVYGDYNCNTWHSIGMNAGGVGPSFVGLWEIKLKEYSSSQDPELEARNYINESIRYPNRYIVPGYPDQMPKTYTEENGFSKEYISGLIEYIKTLK